MKDLDIVKKVFEKIFEKNTYFFHEVDKEKYSHDKVHSDHCSDGDILIFEDRVSWENGLMELYSINKAKKTILQCYFFCYRVDHPGVYMYKDGSGEPPSSEMSESEKTGKNLVECLLKLINHIIEVQIDEVMQSIQEQDMDDQYESDRSEAIEDYRNSEEYRQNNDNTLQ